MMETLAWIAIFANMCSICFCLYQGMKMNRLRHELLSQISSLESTRLECEEAVAKLYGMIDQIRTRRSIDFPYIIPGGRKQ